jgi:hypothetical protein
VVGKTREGKTNLVVWLCSELRKYVLALDPKGEDESLSASGWERVATVPGGRIQPKFMSRGWRQWERIQTDIAEKVKPVRLIAGTASRTREQDARNRELMREGIEYVRQAGGFTLVVDEHQVLSDQRMFGLGSDIARQAITAARDGVTVISNMQFLSWVEKAPVRQSTIIAVCKTRDRDLVKLVASAAGRPWQEIAAAVDELDKYWWLLIGDESRAPMIAVRPPKVT